MTIHWLLQTSKIFPDLFQNFLTFPWPCNIFVFPLIFSWPWQPRVSSLACLKALPSKIAHYLHDIDDTFSFYCKPSVWWFHTAWYGVQAHLEYYLNCDDKTPVWSCKFMKGINMYFPWHFCHWLSGIQGGSELMFKSM